MRKNSSALNNTQYGPNLKKTTVSAILHLSTSVFEIHKQSINTIDFYSILSFRGFADG